GGSRRGMMSTESDGGFAGVGGVQLSATARTGQDLRITADTPTNSIVVRALSSDIDQIKKIIELIDVPMVEQVQIYPVQHGNASEMATTLAKIFAADEKGEGGPQTTRITADADTNKLLVWATHAKQAMIAAI